MIKNSEITDIFLKDSQAVHGAVVDDHGDVVEEIFNGTVDNDDDGFVIAKEELCMHT